MKTATLWAPWGTMWLLLPLMACQSKDQSVSGLFERTDSVGVEVVRLLRSPSETLRLSTPALRVGASDAAGAAQDAFQLLTDLVILPGERIAVVDNTGARVAVFAPTGEWLYDLGRRGNGPGEYTAPIYASTIADTVFVWDISQRRLSRYSSEGQHLGSDQYSGWTGGRRVVAVHEGYIREVESGQGVDPEPARGALVRIRRSGEQIDTLAGPYPIPETGWVITDPETGRGHMVNPPALEIYPPWNVGSGELVWLDPYEVSVKFHRLQSGDLVRIVQLPYRPLPPSPEDREAFCQGIQEEFGIPDEAMASCRTGTVFGDLRPPLAGLLVDDQGRIWIAKHEPRTRAQGYVGSDWDLIDMDANSAIRVQFPTGFRLMAVRDGRAYGIATLDLGVQVVDVFELPG